MPGDTLKTIAFWAAAVWLVLGLLSLTTGNLTGLAFAAVALGVMYWASDGKPLGGRSGDIV